MKTSDNLQNETPESGLSVLSDGRVQVIFQKVDLTAITQLPNSVYSIIRELCLVTSPLTDSCTDGLFNLLLIMTELTPDNEDLAKGFIRFKTPSPH